MKTVLIALVFFFASAGLCISAEEQSIHGTYISKGDPKEYLSLYPDGSFVLKQRKNPPQLEDPFEELTGKYSLSGESLKLQLKDGGEATGKLKDNKFEDDGGAVWAKQGTEKPKPLDRPKRSKIKFN